MNRVMSWTGRGIFTAYASCVVWAVCVFTHEPRGIAAPPAAPAPYWIVPVFVPAEPLVWWEIAPGRWVNAAPYPTLVEIGGGEVMLVAPDGIIHHDPRACRAQCAPGECALCVWSSGVCWVRCEQYAPWNPAQWGGCVQSCDIDPGTIIPTDTEPSDMDDDKIGDGDP